jgi:hypothetical protein
VGRAVKLVHVLVPRLPADRSYRILLMRRDWHEVLASQRVMLEHRGAVPEGPGDVRLAEIFAAQLAEVESWVASSARADLLEVDFNLLLREPLPTARRIAAFLDGELDPEDMAAAVLPCLYRQRSLR